LSVISGFEWLGVVRPGFQQSVYLCPKKELEKMQEKIQLSYARPPKKQFLLPSEKKENYPKEMRLKCLSV